MSLVVIDIANQYRIISEPAAGAGWADKTTRGRIRFDGNDRASFLQALLTNEIAALPVNGGTYALYLTPQGRLITDLHVFMRSDCAIADVPVENAPALAEVFDRLVFSEDVRGSDVSANLSQSSVIGATAAAALARAFSIPEAAIRDLPMWHQLPIPGGFLARTDDARQASYDVFLSADSTGFADAIEGAGAVRLDDRVLEFVRIEAGRPRFGVDMTTETIPLEAGLLDRAISQSKGCYVGQEVIVRVLHRGGGRVVRRLVCLTTDGHESSPPAAGASVSVGGQDVGRVTSAVRPPDSAASMALAYVHRDAADVGREVELSWADTKAKARISALAG